MVPNRAIVDGYRDALLGRLEGLLSAQRAEFRGAQKVLRREIEALRLEIEKQKRVRVYAVSEEEERLKQMNQHLLGELQRRRLEAEAEKERRPWWRWWGR